ncbi:MAG: sugar phosphate isomerase/epimerase [bacterium]|jgi:sugar phosphate isomerase/epimerase
MFTPDKLSLNTATVSEQWNLRQAVDGCVRHGIAGIAPWRNKLHEAGVSEGAKMIDDAGLSVSGLCRGGWYTAEGALTVSVLDDNKRAVDEAVEINAACLVMVVGGLSQDSKDIQAARDIVTEGLASTLEYARSVNMPIAIEPLHPMYAADRACVNTTSQALDICDQLGDGIGVALDVYHIWWDPDLTAQIKRAGKQRLLAFHICDWLNPTRDLLTDRGMMGDGVIDIAGIHALVQAEGFDGLNEVEIFSANDWWKRDADEVLAIMVERSAGLSSLSR